MSMSEKRYFNLYAQRHTIGERNNYILLFDLVEQMPHYVNEELIKKLHGHDLSTKHLASDKNYLYQLILKSLSLYHSGKSSSLKVKEWLHQIEILYAKGLYRQCLQLIKKARSLAEKYDLYALVLEITKWECKALGNSGQLEAMNRTLNSARKDLNLQSNLYDFQDLYYQMLLLRREIGIARNNETINRLNLFMQREDLKREENAQSTQAKIYFWRIWAMFYYASGEKTQELLAMSELRRLMEDDPLYKQEFAMDYAVTCGRILQLKQNVGEEEFQHEMKMLRGFPDELKKGRRKIRAEVESFSTLTALSRMIERGNYKNAIAYIEDINAVFDQYDALIKASRKLSYLYTLAYVYLACGLPKEALQYVNKILNEYDAALRPEIHAFARILNLIIHFELGNYRVIHYAAESTNRYLKKRDRLFRLENYLLKCFKKLSNTHSRNKRVKIFEECKHHINEILTDDFERRALLYFDLMRWVEAQIQGKSFLEVKMKDIPK